MIDEKLQNMKPEGFCRLETLKLGGCINVGDSALNKILPISKNIKFVELNNLEKIGTEYTLKNLS